MKMIKIVLITLLFLGCAGVTSITHIDGVLVGEPSFFPTIAAHTDAPILSGNKVEVLLNGEQTFPAMLKAIRGARKSITYAQYLYQDGAIAYELAEAFAERCRAGVTVKLLIDSHGGSKIPKDIPDLLVKSGCQLEWFRRIRLFQFITPWELLRYNYRNHRRILVVDGLVGFTGGHGVSEAWTGDGRTDDHWRDTDVRIEGPIVQQLQAAFVESWRETTGRVLGGDVYFPVLKPRGKVYAQIVKSSPYGGTFESYMLLLLSIASARKSIHISNPYFLPDERIQEALLTAVKRGVSVVVITPGKIDHKLVYWASRQGFAPLLLGGIQIYEYQVALMHAKTMVVDSVWANVGTTNLDNRSFALNEEINLIVYDRGVAAELEKAFAQDLRHSKKLTYEAWKSRPWREKFLELFTIPFKEQL
ncbi:MAG: cardiolipin synthase [Deltaproteobacteria bacterium]|nr:cardiolipin synthase [Deltaproteobacteria bacterium]